MWKAMEKNDNVELEDEMGKGKLKNIYWGMLENMYVELKKEFRFGNELRRENDLSKLIKDYYVDI